MWKLAVTLLLLASVPSTIAANNTTIAASNTNEVSEASLSRPKRFVLLFCINFPACCDVRGKDLCGFACPKCPLRLDKYGVKQSTTTTTPKPAAAGGGLAALAAAAGGGGQGGLAALLAASGGGQKPGGGQGGQLAALAAAAGQGQKPGLAGGQGGQLAALAAAAGQGQKPGQGGGLAALLAASQGQGGGQGGGLAALLAASQGQGGGQGGGLAALLAASQGGQKPDEGQNQLGASLGSVAALTPGIIKDSKEELADYKEPRAPSAAPEAPAALLAKNPQIQALLQGRSNTDAGDMNALLQNPKVLALLKAMHQLSAPPAEPCADDLLKNPSVVAKLKALMKINDEKPASGSAPTTASTPGISGIPGFAELAASFPGGPAALQKLLNDPQVLNFITKNPDIVKKFVSDGPPNPEKLKTLLALAAPPPPGVKQGVFGPDIFEGEVFDVQGFDYDDEDIKEEDEDVKKVAKGPTSGPAAGSGSKPSITGIPGFAELAAAFPGGPAALQKVLNDPQVLDFITKNPDIVKKFVSDGPPNPEKLQTLLALAAPPPPGTKQGVFGPDIFEGEVFDVQGFDYDYEEDDKDVGGKSTDDDEGSDYGDFEGNVNDLGRKGKSRTDFPSFPANPNPPPPVRFHSDTLYRSSVSEATSKPIIKYKYRLLGHNYRARQRLK